METQDRRFLLHAIYKTNGVAGVFIQKSCTEYASYPDAWVPVTGHSDTITAYVNNGFDGKGGRLLDINMNTADPQLPFNVILIPNYGPAARAWWWGYGATADNLTDVINGKAWGSFKADGIKKRLVAIDRSPNGQFAFVLNEQKPGQVWWWGHGATVANITDVINGKAWGSFKADGIKKRLVSVKRYAQGNWTFIMVPWEPGVDWWWWPGKTWQEIGDFAKANNARIVDLERYGSSEDSFTVILMKNT